MATVKETETVHEVEPEVAAYMRLWGVNEEAARGMIELEKAGIRWVTPIVYDEDTPTPE